MFIADIATSYSDGPGKRIVIYFSGCHKNCDSCFSSFRLPSNPLTYDEIKNTIASLMEESIVGFTFSGGEFFLRDSNYLIMEIIEEYNLPIIIYTGLTTKELYHKSYVHTFLKSLLKGETLVSVLKTGPFEVNNQKNMGDILRVCSNQQLLILNDKIPIQSLVGTISSTVRISNEGSVTVTGFSSFKEFT